MRKILVVVPVIAVIVGIMWIMKPWEIPQETGGEKGPQEGGGDLDFTGEPPGGLSRIPLHFFIHLQEFRRKPNLGEL